MRIRAAVSADLPGMYAVCLRTADSGDDGRHLFHDPDLVGHNYVGPYLSYDPAGVWVIDDDGAILGYAIGVADTSDFERCAAMHWLPNLRERYPLSALDNPSLTEGDRWMIDRLHGGIHTPESIALTYPGHAHIDLVPAAQGRGYGRQLMQLAMDVATVSGSQGMHLDVSPHNRRARDFYARLGFVEGPQIDGTAYLVYGPN